MKHFWHYIEGKRQDSIGIDTLKNQSGNIVTDPSEKAEILNNHFKSLRTLLQSQIRVFHLTHPSQISILQ